MPREEYELTPQTKEALENEVQGIALEMEKSDKYLYAILSGKETDPYAKFRPLFRGVARHCPERTNIYLADLHAIADRTPRRKTESRTDDDFIVDINHFQSKLIDAHLGKKSGEEIESWLDKLLACAMDYKSFREGKGDVVEMSVTSKRA